MMNTLTMIPPVLTPNVVVPKRAETLPEDLITGEELLAMGDLSQLRTKDILRGEEVLEGFALPLSELFTDE